MAVVIDASPVAPQGSLRAACWFEWRAWRSVAPWDLTRHASDTYRPTGPSSRLRRWLSFRYPAPRARGSRSRSPQLGVKFPPAPPCLKYIYPIHGWYRENFTYTGVEQWFSVLGACRARQWRARAALAVCEEAPGASGQHAPCVANVDPIESLLESRPTGLLRNGGRRCRRLRGPRSRPRRSRARRGWRRCRRPRQAPRGAA